LSARGAETLPGGAGGLEFLDIGGEIAALSPLQLFWRRFRQDRVAMISLGFIGFLVLLAVLLIEFLLQGSASILHRLTGRRPPRRTWMANEIDRIESQLRHHDPPR